MAMNVMDVFINQLMSTADIITGISGQVEFVMSEREHKLCTNYVMKLGTLKEIYSEPKVILNSSSKIRSLCT